MTISVFAIGITVSADEAEASNNATYVYYSGQKLDSATPYLLMGKAADATSTTVKASAADTDSDGVWSVLAQFDAQTGTLTFKNGNDITTNSYALGFPLVKIDADGDGETTNDKYYGIYANGNLTVDLGIYVNLLYFPRDSSTDNSRNKPKDAAQEGIHVDGDLTVNGTQKGLLRVTANPAGKENAGLQSYGIYSSGTVTLNGGILDTYETVWGGDNYKLSTNKTTFIKANNVELKGGSLYLRGRALADPSTYANNFKLHDIGAENTDAINVPDSYNQSWDNYLELTTGTDEADNNDKNKGNDVNDSSDFKSTREANMLYVKYTPVSGFRIKVMGQELGGDKKYLHIGDNNTVTVSDVAEDASAEYDITRDSEGTITKELKFLKDTSLSYNVTPSSGNAKYYVIESDSDLIVNTNGKTVSLAGNAADWNGWNITRGACVRADGNVTLNGGGTLNAYLGTQYATEASSSDKSATSVIYSGSKITIDDITATLWLGDERGSSTGSTTPQSNILYAPQVVFTDNANVKMAKNKVPGGTTPGYLIGGADSAEKVIIPNTADAFVGDSKSQWGQAVKASDKLYDYTSGNMKTSTYMEVSTADKTVAVTSIGLNDDNVVDPTANTVKITLANADESAAEPDVFVIAAASDANGVLTSVVSFSGKANGDEREMIIGGGSSVKVYVWSTSDGLKPLKKVRTYYAAETTDTTVTD